MILLVMFLLIVLVACDNDSANSVNVGELQKESQTIELGSTEKATVTLEMGAGELRVKGGSAELVDADFTYNVALWKPIVTSSNGSVKITTPENTTINSISAKNLDEMRNEWNIRLNDSVALDLAISLGAGSSTLNLAGLNLRSAAIETGAGETVLDLSGDWQHDATIEMDAGVGELRIIVPSDVGVSAEITKGLGTISADGFTKDGDTYTNSAHGSAAVTLTLNIDAGIGEITLETK